MIVESSDLAKAAAELRKEIYDGIENFASPVRKDTERSMLMRWTAMVSSI